MAYIEMREHSKSSIVKKLYKTKEAIEDLCEELEEMEEELGSRGSYRDDEDWDERGGSGSYRRGGYRRRSGGGY